MKPLRVITSFFLLLSAASNGSEFRERLDLERLLTDPGALPQLVIEYEPGNDTVLFIYGTGAVVKQAYPPLRPNALVPTCTGKVSQDEVRELVRVLMRRHFFDLEIRSYFYATVSDDLKDFWKMLQLHSITIDDGKTRASRGFASGVYQDRKEIVPADFAVIEEVLRHIGSVTEGKPCHVSPVIKLPAPPEPKPSSLPS
jgi:hypothetical protein